MEKKKFFIETLHSVYVDSFEDGEQENVNYYKLNGFISAGTTKQAIEKYFENVLFYNFKFEDCDIYDGFLNYSVLVDVENSEATKSDIELWKKGEKTLYSNNISLSISILLDAIGDDNKLKFEL